MSIYRKEEDFFVLIMKIKPNSSNNKIMKFSEEELVISINASPDRERANKELVKYLSQIFECTKDKIQIVNGTHSTNKTVKIGLSIESDEIIKLIKNEMN